MHRGPAHDLVAVVGQHTRGATLASGRLGPSIVATSVNTVAGRTSIVFPAILAPTTGRPTARNWTGLPRAAPAHDYQTTPVTSPRSARRLRCDLDEGVCLQQRQWLMWAKAANRDPAWRLPTGRDQAERHCCPAPLGARLQVREPAERLAGSLGMPGEGDVRQRVDGGGPCRGARTRHRGVRIG